MCASTGEADNYAVHGQLWQVPRKIAVIDYTCLVAAGTGCTHYHSHSLEV